EGVADAEGTARQALQGRDSRSDRLRLLEGRQEPSAVQERRPRRPSALTARDSLSPLSQNDPASAEAPTGSCSFSVRLIGSGGFTSSAAPSLPDTRCD